MHKPTTHPIDISNEDFTQIKNDVWKVIANDQEYPRKIRSKNFYKKLSPDLLKKAHALISSYPETKGLTWYFEIFHSSEAVEKHNDRNLFPQRNELCERGLIIPLEWSATVPATRFYDLYIEEKVNWDGRGFKTLDGIQKPFESGSLQKRIDLPWKEKTILFFDSRQIHDASIFQEKPSDFKLSINALGYSHFPPQA